MTDDAIRPATVADAAAIAALHAASWRSAYRGILKERTLGPTLDGERRPTGMASSRRMTPDDTVLIAGDVGFIAVWADGRIGFRRLYRQSACPSRAAQRRPWPAPAGRGDATGRRPRREGRYLWVFDDNLRAIDFYCRLGGEIVEGGFDEIDGVQVAHSRIAWRDTARLADACGA